MKKTATLIAGLLLVSGTIFAGDLDFSGTQVKFKSTLVNSQAKGVNDDSNGDTDAILQVKYKIDEKTSASLKFNTDDSSNGSDFDDNAELLVKRTDGPLEAQFDLELDFSNTVNVKDGTSTTFAFQMKEDNDSNKTYVKWKKSDTLTLGFYPFNMGMVNGTAFDEDDAITEIPGVVATLGNSYVGLGYDTVDSSNSVLALKAGHKLVAGKATINAKYSGVFYNEDKIKTLSSNTTLKDVTSGNGGTVGAVSQDINVNLNYKLSEKITVDAEAGYNVLNKNYTIAGAKDTDGLGLSVKATAKLTNVLTSYAQVKYTTDGYLAYGDMLTLNKTKKSGGISEGIIGADYTLVKGLVLNAEASVKSAGETIYVDKDTKAVKSAIQLSGSVAYKF